MKGRFVNGKSCRFQSRVTIQSISSRVPHALRTLIIVSLIMQSNLTAMGTYEEAVAELEAWQAQRSARLADFAAVEVRPASSMQLM